MTRQRSEILYIPLMILRALRGEIVESAWDEQQREKHTTADDNP